MLLSVHFTMIRARACRPTHLVHRVRDVPVRAHFQAVRQFGRERRDTARSVRRDAARHDEPDATLGTLRQKRAKLRQTATQHRTVFEARVHAAHEGPVLQDRESCRREWESGVVPFVNAHERPGKRTSCGTNCVANFERYARYWCHGHNTWPMRR